MDIGKQYDKDDVFKKKARLHQSNYRTKILKAAYNEYGNRLIDDDAYLNYYQFLNVLEDKRKRYPNYSKKRDADMLRSEHIPFNIFSPLKLDFEFSKNIFNKLLGNVISEIKEIKIEYAPHPKGNYLNDGTSFDTYIEFKHNDNSKGALGIEVKYTEQAYSLGETEKENIKNINKLDSIYSLVTKKSDLYIENSINDLIKDDYRQIWRNHILGESMKQKGELKHFISLTLYPLGNNHFAKVIPKYKNLLKPDKKDLFVGVTFEKLFNVYSELNNKGEYKDWIDFLKRRYITTNSL